MHVSGAESAQSAAAASLSLVPQTGEGLMLTGQLP